MTAVLSAIALAFALLYLMVVSEERRMLHAAKPRKSQVRS
jgi:hypothetical protein